MTGSIQRQNIGRRLRGAADGKNYVVTRRGGTQVLAAVPQFKQLAYNKFDDYNTFNASPVISDGQLLLRSEQYLYCVGICIASAFSAEWRLELAKP